MGNLPTIRVRDNQENLQQVVATLEALEIGITAYREGKSAGWMIVSAYLNQLLTDKTRIIPLLQRLAPQLGFHQLHHNLAGSEDKYLLRADTIIHSGSTFQDIFNLDKKTLSLDSWLSQVIYIQNFEDKGYAISLNDLLIAPRNQGGGVHFDPDVSLNLHLIEGMFSFILGEEQVTFRDCLVIIGEYIHNRITYELMGALANGYRDQGLFEKAQEFLDTAWQKARTAGDLQSQCVQLQNLGNLHSQLGNHAKAAQHYEDARRINKLLGDFETEQSILRNLAITWINIGNQNFNTDSENQISAIQAYEKAVEYAKTGQDNESFIIALANLGDLHFKRSNLQSAALVATKSFLAFWELEETEKQSFAMRQAFTRVSKILFMLYRREQNFEQILYETLKLIDTEYSNAQHSVSGEEHVGNVKREILDYLAQLLVEFPEQ